MDFDSQTLRTFRAVIETGSFSLAAKRLGVSQPNVSQRIARLEAQLGNRLFERNGHAIRPTQLAARLNDFASPWLEDLAGFTSRLREETETPQGLVRLAKPESCLWTPAYQRVLRLLGELPKIRLDIAIVPNEAVVAGVLDDKYDFGFVVGERTSPDLRFETFSEEQYVAVHAKGVKPRFEKGEPLRLVTYPGWETFFRLWASHHGVSKRVSPVSVLHVGSLAGAIEALAQGAGTGIVPKQCVEKALSGKLLVSADPKGASRPARSAVYLIRRLGYRLPARAEVVLKKLREMARA